MTGLITERIPRGPLARIVEKLWVLDNVHLNSTERELRLIPDGRIELVFFLGGGWSTHSGNSCQNLNHAVLLGQRSRYLDLDLTNAGMVLGARFRSVGAAGLLRLPLATVYEQVIGVEEGCKHFDWTPFTEQRSKCRNHQVVLAHFERILTSALPSPISQDTRLAGQLVTEVERLHGSESVRQLSMRTGVGVRRIERLFFSEVGMTPKQYCRLMRFRRVLLNLAQNSEEMLQHALDAGYYDQSHFIHSFRSFTGVTPSEYASKPSTSAH